MTAMLLVKCKTLSSAKPRAICLSHQDTTRRRPSRTYHQQPDAACSRPLGARPRFHCLNKALFLLVLHHHSVLSPETRWAQRIRYFTKSNSWLGIDQAEWILLPGTPQCIKLASRKSQAYKAEHRTMIIMALYCCPTEAPERKLTLTSTQSFLHNPHRTSASTGRDSCSTTSFMLHGEAHASIFW